MTRALRRRLRRARERGRRLVPVASGSLFRRCVSLWLATAGVIER